jgi:hypothetical protein
MNWRPARVDPSVALAPGPRHRNGAYPPVFTLKSENGLEVLHLHFIDMTAIINVYIIWHPKIAEIATSPLSMSINMPTRWSRPKSDCTKKM